MSQDIGTAYSRLYPQLVDAAARLEAHLKGLLQDVPHLDRISARAKSPARFEMKAKKQQEDGRPKYTAPLQQIQDQIGARVIVFYRNDVDVVAGQLERYLRYIEAQELVPDSQWEFGYFGNHWIFALPAEVVPGNFIPGELPRFFELQVKTLYQHAWSEANHDLGYKAIGSLSADQQRRFAYTSAQSWGADRVFEELRAELLDVGGRGEDHLEP